MAFVCDRCFENESVAEFVRKHAEEPECEFCDRVSDDGISNIAADVSDVAAFVRDKLAEEFDDPVEEVSFNSAEGGYIGTTIYETTEELFNDALGEFPCSNSDLIKELLKEIGDQAWCKRDPYGISPDEGLSIGWSEFCSLVKHRTRFMFFPRVDDADLHEPYAVLPGQVLEIIGSLIASEGLVSEIPKGTLLHRARTHPAGESLTTAEQLGPPPVRFAGTNRMNPAGIPMFYGGMDERTAISEVMSTSGPVSIGQFETTKAIPVVDLTRLKPSPDIYAEGSREEKASKRFLHHFVSDATLPVVRDGTEHINYVPTQIVTEYIRHRFVYSRASGKLSHVLGILYPSVKQRDGINAVLFLEGRNIEGIDDSGIFKAEKYLRLVRAKTIP